MRTADPAAGVATAWDGADRPCVVIADEGPAACVHARRLLGELAEVDVVLCGDGARALYECGRRSPAAVVLSASLPLVAAADVAAVLAADRDRVGTIAAAVADGQAELGAAVLAAGADRLVSRDYGTAEVRSLLLRDVVGRDRAGRRASVLQLGAVRLDWPAFEVTVHGRRVPLTLREFEVLGTLMRHAGKVVSQGLLRQELGEARGAMSANTLSVHVRHLRGHLRGALGIEAVRGIGYRLRVDQDVPAGAVTPA